MARRLVTRSKVHEQPGYEWAAERWLVRKNSERWLPFHKVAGIVLIDLDALVERGRVELTGPVALRSLRPVARKRSA